MTFAARFIGWVKSLVNQFQRSLRFRSGASSYMVRTPATAGNRRTNTLYALFKRGALGSIQMIFSIEGGANDNVYLAVYFDASDRLVISGYSTVWATTNAVYRNPGAHMSLQINVDTTQAVGANRIRVYVNNVEVTSWSVDARASIGLNGDLPFNIVAPHYIGRRTTSAAYPIDATFTRVALVSGVTVAPSEFATVVGSKLTFKDYAGDYGTHGFLLKFDETTSLATLGRDSKNASVPFSFSDPFDTLDAAWVLSQNGGSGASFTINSGRLAVASYGSGTSGPILRRTFTTPLRDFDLTFTNVTIGYTASSIFNVDLTIGHLGNTNLFKWIFADSWADAGSDGAVGGYFYTNGSQITFTQGSTFSGDIRIVRTGTTVQCYSNGVLRGAATCLADPVTTITIAAQETSGYNAPAVSMAAVSLTGMSGGNDWTPFNFSLSAGVTYDSMLDVPLGDGGGDRGNYATLNPLVTAADSTLSSGNLVFAYGSSSTIGITYATVGITTGEYWWTTTILTNSSGSTSALIVGMSLLLSGSANNYPGFNSLGGWGYYGDTGAIYNNGSTVATGATFTVGDVIGCRFDATTGVLRIYKQTAGSGSFVLQATITSIPADTYFPAWGDGGGTRLGSAAVNFGQQPLSETSWLGPAKALHTGNLPEPVIPKPTDHFNTVLWSGNATVRSITGVGFEPGLVFGKARNSGTANFRLFDVVRGPTKEIYSSLTNAETTDVNSLTSFNADGFGLGVGGSLNNPGDNYVAWCFKAGGAAVTNNAGSISAQVSANPAAGFSIATYTGLGANATVGHGLGVAPKLILAKQRGASGDWFVYHASANASPQSGAMFLNLTVGFTSNSGYWGNVAPTSTTFAVGVAGGMNASGVTSVAYCFAEIPGYSKIGAYIGNADGNGPHVYCGFEPAFLLIKRTDAVSGWYIYDCVRNTFNPVNNALFPHSAQAEAQYAVDFTATGFKVRSGPSTGLNDGGGTYAYMAIAKTPLKYALAR